MDFPCRVHRENPRLFGCWDCNEIYRGLTLQGEYKLDTRVEYLETYINLFHEQKVLDDVLMRLKDYGKIEYDEKDLKDHYGGLLHKHLIKFRWLVPIDPNIQHGEERHGDKFLRLKSQELRRQIREELYFYPFRERLKKWIRFQEPGTALFVKALMGLGKTHSVIQGLSDNPELSAIIFVPTKELAETICFQLKDKIGYEKHGDEVGAGIEQPEELAIKSFEQSSDLYEERDGLLYWKEEYFPLVQERYRKDFLSEEVYHLEGINEEDCPYFHRIIARYHLGLYYKRDICMSCRKYKSNQCEFITQMDTAKKARIIITTHQQYNRFYNAPRLALWDKKEGPVERSFFIVDEDMIGPACFDPYLISYKNLKQLISDIVEFFSEVYEGTGYEQFLDNLMNLFGRVSLAETTSVIKGVHPEFAMSEELRSGWNNFFAAEKYRGEIPNIIDHIEEGIRIGCVVHKYSKKDVITRGDEGVFNIYFPNPQKYDISDFPAHIFFDGTPYGTDYIREKLCAKISDFQLDVPPLGKLSVKQNWNTDLPRWRRKENRRRVETAIRDIVKRHGRDKSYFIVSTKDLREDILKHFLPTLGVDYVSRHYKHLRGINDAKDCDIGIMVGSYLESDALDVGRSLPYIQDQLSNRIIEPTLDNFYYWGDKNHRMVYREKYKAVEDISFHSRIAEQKQAMARTRYPLHDVLFYVFSKDDVKQYEPHAYVEYGYANKLFPLHKTRIDSSYEEVKQAAFELAQKGYKIIKVPDIKDRTGIKRDQTIRTHLSRVAEEVDWLEKRQGKYYYFVIQDKIDRGSFTASL